jgi:hypothetical protein
MGFRHKPIVSFLAGAVLYMPQVQAADSPCTGQSINEAINLAVSGAMESVRSEVFNPNIESQRADLGEAIALLDQQRAEIQTILANWDPAVAADWLARMAKTMADLVIDLCRLGCPSGGADVVIQMRDKVYEHINGNNPADGNEALPSRFLKVEKLALNYPSKKVKKSARAAHGFAKDINSSIRHAQDDGGDRELRNSLVKLDDKLGKLQSHLLSLNSKLANLEAQNKGFPAVFANLTEKALKTGKVEFSCSESHSTGEDGDSGSDGGFSVSTSSSHSSDVND